MSESDFQKFNDQGFIFLRSVLNEDILAKIEKELAEAVKLEAKYHGTTEYADYGMVLNCALYGSSFWEIFEIDSLIKPINRIMGEGCITYAYTSSSMPPKSSNYSNRIHVDSPRIISDYITNLGVTIAISSFTEENGATYFLPNSYHKKETPSEEEFFKKSVRFLAAPGDVCIFNARTWHSGGQNNSNNWRHALTMNICKPWMKQRIDIPRSLQDMDITSMSDKTKQKLGFYAQVPANYDEYYSSPENRKFKQKTE